VNTDESVDKLLNRSYKQQHQYSAGKGSENEIAGFQSFTIRNLEKKIVQ